MRFSWGLVCSSLAGGDPALSWMGRIDGDYYHSHAAVGGGCGLCTQMRASRVGALREKKGIAHPTEGEADVSVI